MAKQKKDEKEIVPLKPARSPKRREEQLTALAMNLAEKRLREGTASSAEIVHFLKLGSPKEKLEREILERQRDLLEAKAEQVRSERTNEEIYEKALSAMRGYSRTIDGEFEEVK